MSFFKSIVGCTLVVGSCLTMLAGCQQGATTNVAHDDHDHGHEHAHPDNYNDLVHEIEHLSDEVLAAFAEGKGEDAHNSLHEVGHLLEDVTSLAKKAGFEGEELEDLTAAAEKAFVAIGSLDTFHGDASAEDIDLDEVSANVKAAIEILHEHVTEDGDHDHEHGDEHDEDHDNDHEEGHDEDDHEHEEES